MSAHAEAIGLVDAYIASNPIESGAEVFKWWRQKKKDIEVSRAALPEGITMSGGRYVSCIFCNYSI